ncbi:MAG: ABC transporter permease [Candidatus Saccharimonadales bacterium]
MKSVRHGHIKAGIDSMRRAKWRNFWTMLGVIIGVSSVITIVSIGEGVKQQISGQIKHVGSDLITVRPAQLRTGDNAGTNNISLVSGVSITGSLSAADAEAVRKLPEVAEATPLTAVAGKVQADTGVYNGGLVIGSSADLPSLLKQEVEYGEFFTDGDDETYIAVLGRGAAQRMFNERVPLGRTFTFHGQQFMVRGILKAFDTTPLSQDANFNNAIFIPTALAQKLTNNTATIYEILAKPKQAENADATVAAITAKLSKLHGGSGAFSVLRQDQNQAASDDILNLMTTLVAGVAAISLLVGGIGIMNVMSVSVVERLHEIGIRKAIGATNRQILGQFMVEATALSLSGGVIGIALAGAIDGLLRIYTDLRPVLSWQIVLLATGVSVAVGVIFGSFPALKAARKDPIEALRSS